MIDDGLIELTGTLDIVDSNNCTVSGNGKIKQVEVFAKQFGAADYASLGTTSSNGLGTWYLSVGPVRETTSYAYRVEGGPLSPAVTVKVDKTTGACSSRVTVSGPDRVPAGSAYTVTGVAPGGEPELLVQDGLGEPRSITLTPAADGRYGLALRATNIATYYAAAGGCASRIVSTYPLPAMSGPATVRRGNTALLHVRALPNETIEIYFHRAGTSGYRLGRTGRMAADGTYTTGFVATADYRYYAKIRGGPAGPPALTQVR